MELAGVCALVSGAGGGIGAGIAEALVEAGARVALADLNRDWAEAEAARIGGECFAIELDVTQPDSWNAARAAAEARFGPVAVLCNNAGIAHDLGPLDEIAPEQFARIMAVNVMGVHNGVRAVVPGMKARRAGHVVNTSSTNGFLPHGTFGAYTASKFAVAGLSEALAQELSPHGIGVSILYPGLTRSRMSEAQMGGAVPAELAARMMEPVWLGRAVVRAIREGRLHIITHPHYRDDLVARTDTLLAAFGEPAQPGYTGGRREG